MTLYTIALWVYSILASLVLGAAVYENLVVHPAWSRQPPESFVSFVGEPLGRMDIAAFWKPVAPLFALSGLAALALAFRAGTQGAPLITSSTCAVLAVAWTLIYFRPMIDLFLEKAGGNTPADRLRSQARRWVRLNWLRTALVAVAWWGATFAAFTTHG
jgi:hypothetical protein